MMHIEIFLALRSVPVQKVQKGWTLSESQNGSKN